ncbi:DUF6464 family protein [Candidatus Cyanaurora vandensis]|uniref:DUF6464 family protein n=1 Tax=Candidatus Cyanaurora vandensis TaxID=2714958 RepID=UPI00257D0317|nr:DUF6464 family protein [Candidatus Cyanaurora vandensis]
MTLPVHLYRSDTREWVGQVPDEIGATPYVEWDGHLWAVLERSHAYNLKSGKYHLQRVALFVRPVAVDLRDRHQVGDHWTIGDPTCRYNAHSELLRCVPHPHGPCVGCQSYARDHEVS